MARTLLIIKKQLKLSLDDIVLKPNVHNHNEVQVYIKDNFVGYGADVSELISESKIRFNDKHPAHSKGVFKVDVMGPTVQDVYEGGLLLLPDDKAYLLDIDTQKYLGINKGFFSFNFSVFTKEMIFILIIVASGFAGIYYRDVIAVQNDKQKQCLPVTVK